MFRRLLINPILIPLVAANWRVQPELSETIGMVTVPFANHSNQCVLPAGPGEMAIYQTKDWKTLAKLTYTDLPRLFTFASYAFDDSLFGRGTCQRCSPVESPIAEIQAQRDGH